MLHNTSQIDVEHPDLDAHPDFGAVPCKASEISGSVTISTYAVYDETDRRKGDATHTLGAALTLPAMQRNDPVYCLAFPCLTSDGKNGGTILDGHDDGGGKKRLILLRKLIALLCLSVLWNVVCTHCTVY